MHVLSYPKHNNVAWFISDGVDYVAINQTITFLPGETFVSATVYIVDDSIHEDNETLIGMLKTSNSTPDYVLIGAPFMAVGTITDDDVLSKYTSIFAIFLIVSGLDVWKECNYLEKTHMVCFYLWEVMRFLKFTNRTTRSC